MAPAQQNPQFYCGTDYPLLWVNRYFSSPDPSEPCLRIRVTPAREFLWVGGNPPIPDCISSQWHQIKGPEICTGWHLEDWFDNDDGVLSQCDKILLAKKPDMTDLHWEHMFYFNASTGQLWTDWYSQKVEPDTPVAFGVDLHNQWLNPVPNTAEGISTGYLEVNKYVYIDYANETREYLVCNEFVELPACLHHSDIFNIQFDTGHHQIKVAVYIVGPELVEVTKEGDIILVPNPFVCQWICYTLDIWSTIPEDVGGAHFDTWHGKEYIAPGGTVGYFVPMEVPAPDCKVDLKDAFTAALAFGSFPRHSKWNSIADVFKDYKIDLKDYFAIVRKYGFAKQTKNSKNQNPTLFIFFWIVFIYHARASENRRGLCSSAPSLSRDNQSCSRNYQEWYYSYDCKFLTYSFNKY